MASPGLERSGSPCGWAKTVASAMKIASGASRILSWKRRMLEVIGGDLLKALGPLASALPGAPRASATGWPMCAPGSRCCAKILAAGRRFLGSLDDFVVVAAARMPIFQGRNKEGAPNPVADRGRQQKAGILGGGRLAHEDVHEHLS